MSQEEKLQHYISTLNTLIEEAQSKKLYKFIIKRLPYIEDYHLDYIAHTDTLKDAETLNEIFESGFKDLASIVVEDGFGIKEYDTTKEENSNIADMCEEMDKEFPFFIELQIEKSIQKELQEIEEKGSTNTPYYKKLTEITQKIDELKAILTMRFKAQNRLRTLEWNFMQIALAVTLARVNNEISKYREVQEFEAQVQKSCKKVIKIAKRHDKKMKKLECLKEKDMLDVEYTVYSCPQCKGTVTIDEKDLSSSSSICPKCNIEMDLMGSEVPLEFMGFVEKVLDASREREAKDANIDE